MPILIIFEKIRIYVVKWHQTSVPLCIAWFAENNFFTVSDDSVIIQISTNNFESMSNILRIKKSTQAPGIDVKIYFFESIKEKERKK